MILMKMVKRWIQIPDGACEYLEQNISKDSAECNNYISLKVGRCV
jgi:hypothetical protein